MIKSHQNICLQKMRNKIEYFAENIYQTALNFLFSLMEKLSHFQPKLITCFISVGHYFIYSRNHHLSTYKLSTSVQTQTLKALLPLPQSHGESSLDWRPRDTVMFCNLGKQVPCLCYLPKDTEMLHQVRIQIPTPATRLHSCQCRNWIFIPCEQEEAMYSKNLHPSYQQEDTVQLWQHHSSPCCLQKDQLQPGPSSCGDAAASLQVTGLRRPKSRTRSPCGSEETASSSARSNQIRQFLIRETSVFTGPNS